MSLQAEMHSLVGQIAAARDTRRAGLSSLRQGVGGQLHQLHQTRQRMAQGLRANLGKVRSGLAQEEAQRSSGVQRGMEEIRGERAAGQAVWRNFAASPQKKMVPEDKSLSSGQGHQGTHRRRQGGEA